MADLEKVEMQIQNIREDLTQLQAQLQGQHQEIVRLVSQIAEHLAGTKSD